MIRYALSCADGHAFEAWFSGSGVFEAQRDAGLLACPVCGSTAIERALMAPAVSTARGREARVGRRMKSSGEGPARSERPEATRLAANLPDKQELITAMRKLRQHLTANAENVGDRFAEEARKIHYNEAEKRGIYGEATTDDARAMAEEGIEFHPLPPLPEDHN